jgi:hypothetical protein
VTLSFLNIVDWSEDLINGSDLIAKCFKLLGIERLGPIAKCFLRNVVDLNHETVCPYGHCSTTQRNDLITASGGMAGIYDDG